MKKKNKSLPFRKIRAINDPVIIKFIKSIFTKDLKLYKSLDDENIHNKFLKSYKRWIKSSKINNLKNLNKFKFACFSNGSSKYLIIFIPNIKTNVLEF